MAHSPPRRAECCRFNHAPAHAGCVLIPSRAAFPPRLDRSEEPDEALEDVCPQNIALRWHAEASSAVYATPLITDLFSDGRKDVVVPSFLHNLEVGADAPWCMRQPVGAVAPSRSNSGRRSVWHERPLALGNAQLPGAYLVAGEEACQPQTATAAVVFGGWSQGLRSTCVSGLSSHGVDLSAFPAPPRAGV